MSKGSTRRPQQIPAKQYDEAWDRIFKPKKPTEPIPAPKTK